MTGKVRRVDFFPDEYIGGVAGKLRADEQGVYWLVCSLIMSEGGPIPFDDRRIAGLTRIRPAEARKIIDRLVQMHKLILTGEGLLSQKRAQSEVDKSANRIQIASENGAKGGRPTGKDEQKQAKPEAAGFPAGKLTTNQQPAEPSNEGSVERTKPAKRRHSYSEAFEAFWSAYPTDALMPKVNAGKAFERLSGEDQGAAIASIPAFKAYCAAHPDYRPVHAERYITQRRFDGFMKAQQQVDSRIFVKVGTSDWQAMCRHRNTTSIPSNEHNGERGWWFSKDEIATARQAMAEQSNSGAVH